MKLFVCLLAQVDTCANRETPPEIAIDLILFLKTIGYDKKLIRTTEARVIEK